MAAYFAVKDGDGDDGELWAMHPSTLNQHSGCRGLPFPNHPGMLFLAMEPWHDSPDCLAKKLGIEVPKYPIALSPPVHSERILAQASAFTIHPKPSAGCTIPELLVEPKFLVRYEIPGAEKKRIRRELTALGITEKSLFPGLDALSRVLIEEQHTIGYGLPDPPNFHFRQAASRS